ncbi:MAG: MG2 domain-containing protein, partial [Proteobacteria bacterium]|nr:MG2 domain-containing protein [Pseudomonadota bacterium]
HVLRRPVLACFAQVAPSERPEKLEIAHACSDDRFELPLAWDANGSATNDWAIPQQAKLGTYTVRLIPRDGQGYGESSGEFRVEEFRVPLMRGVLAPPRDALVAVNEFPLDLAVQYLSGGGASSLPATLRTQIRRRDDVEFAGFEGFAFARGGVTEGVRRSSFGESEPYWEHEWLWAEDGSLGGVWRKPEGSDSSGPIASQSLTLDAAGTTRAEVAGLPRADRPLDVQAELEFRDPSGEVQTSSRTIPIWPSSRVVGLLASKYAAIDAKLQVQGAVVDLDGKPLRLAGVTVDAYERRSYAARKRMVGGFYAYDTVEEVRKLGTFCSNRTDRQGRFRCEGPPPARGELVLVARSADWLYREATTNTTVYVAGAGDDWFAQGDGDRIDVIAEKPRYEPGETARLQVRMPFREATALVSVEREGIDEAFVTKLSGRDSVVEVPVSGSFAPNAYVSVLVVRGREAEPAPTGVVDLAKPAYRLGIAEIRVGWRDDELTVRVDPEHPSYRVREKALVRVAVRTPDGAAPPPGSEVAIAAVDEGLLELWPNHSWALLDAMMGRRAYAVQNATASMQVVGKRHFGRKAVPSGGGGGKQTTRELFDTLLLWRARVPLDAQGNASVEIPLNDSLTSFRIAAIATGGDARFGSGEASIRTTQQLMILSGLPQLVREGDRFAAGFTLRNTTDVTQQVTLRARVAGLAQPPAPIAVSLAAGEASELHWDVDVPAGIASLDWEVDVESAAGIRDQLKLAQRVVPSVPVRVLQATLAQLAPSERIEVERPAGALPGRGGIEVAVRPRLADGRDGIERAMREYPYDCLEQRVSIAVALRDAERWRAVTEMLPAYLDGDGFARFFPGSGPGSEVLTAYLLAIRRRCSAPSRPHRCCCRTPRCSIGSPCSSACRRSRSATRVAPRQTACCGRASTCRVRRSASRPAAAA